VKVKKDRITLDNWVNKKFDNEMSLTFGEWNEVQFKNTRFFWRTQAGGTPKVSERAYYNGDIPFVKIEDITRSEKYLKNTMSSITEDGLKNSSAWMVPPKSILFSMYASYGEVAINTIPVATNQAILAIIPNIEKVNIQYLYYSLISKKDSLISHIRETTQKNLNAEIVRNLKVSLPPLPEQQRIATVLATVDEAIAATDAVITRLESLTETLESSLVVRGVEIADLTNSRIGRIPNHWKTATIGMLSKVQGGIQKTKDRIPKSNYYRYLTVAHVQRKRIFLNDPRFFEASKEELEKYRLKIGDILIIEGNGNPDQVGRAALFRGEITDCIYQNHIIRIRVNADLIIPDYAIAFINSSHGREQIKLLGMSSSGLYTLSTNRIRSIVLPLPPLPEQRRIAAILATVDDRLATERTERDRLVTLKKGLMQVLLTGRVRVPPGVAEEVAPAHV